ncbi:MAG: FCD domain-containing protein [Mesorhizobium sp.]
MNKPKGETRASDVLQRMRNDIVSCALLPGERLRFEALRDRYEVSFSTLREALSRLFVEELVVFEEQKGFFVSPVSIDDLLDLTNTRVLIEKEALRLSIIHGDDAWEASIVGSFHRMHRLQERLGEQYFLNEEWSPIHEAFHLALVSACRSPNLLGIRHKLGARALRYRRMSSTFRVKWRSKEVEHKAIMDAALARDEALALSRIESHIRETTENLIKYAGHFFSDDAKEPLRAASG